MTVLVEHLVPDQLWALVEPLLLAPPDRVGEGRRVDQLHLEVLDRLGEQDRLDWSRASAG